MSKLTHLDAKGAAHMVDIAKKHETARKAEATGRIRMNSAALNAIRDGHMPKGDVLAAARIAGIMAAKQTSAIIPLCHPLALGAVAIDFSVEADGISATTSVSLSGKTGAEMEALTATSVALLTIYDMAKALDKEMMIEGLRLIAKSGGKSGDWHAGQ